MNDLYSFNGGVYAFYNIMDPVLESELKKCKTQKERDEVLATYQTTIIWGSIVAIILGAVVCGGITLLVK